jgi:hypothetical protein
MQKSQRLTIKPHNIAYLQCLASQMGITDLSEVINYLLLDVKGLNYTFGSKPAPQPQQTSLGYSFDTSIFEPAFAPLQENQNAIDPTIQRLIDAGLEMDF